MTDYEDTPIYQETKKLYGHLSDDEKLRTLRMEVLSKLATINGYAKLVKQMHTHSHELTVPDLVGYFEKVGEAAEALRSILIALTEPTDNEQL